MNPIFRLVLAVVAGVAVACMVIGLVDMVNSHFYPSSILHPTISEQADLIARSPVSEFLLVLTGYILSAFFGAYAAARIAPGPKKMVSALFVGFFLLLCGIFYFILIPQPIWFCISSGIAYFLFAYLGGKVAIR
jgi:hypothetical protein